MTRLALLLVFASFVCAEDGAQPDRKPDPRVLGEGKAPTPFTADEIRAACPKGRVSLFRVSGGGQAVLVRFRFGEGDANSVRLETAQLTEDKKPLAPPVAKTATWRQLQAHASYDERATTISEATVEVPFGKFDCLLYTLKGTRGVQRFYFAKALPGPPIRVVVEAGGKTVQSMELLDHRSFDYAKVFGLQARGPEAPGGWTAKASVAEPEKDGPLKLTAAVEGAELPPRCQLEVTGGALKGAVLTLERSADGKALTCEKALPAGFRMKTGALAVRARAMPPAE